MPRIPSPPYDELAAALREEMRAEARIASPPIDRGKVRSAEPLIVEMDDFVLEEGDPDVEFDRRLLTETGRPEVGDTVRVHQDADGDWIVGGVLD